MPGVGCVSPHPLRSVAVTGPARRRWCIRVNHFFGFCFFVGRIQCAKQTFLSLAEVEVIGNVGHIPKRQPATHVVCGNSVTSAFPGLGASLCPFVLLAV